MKSAPYIAIVSPKLLDFLGWFSPIVIGNHTTMLFVPIIVSRRQMSEGTERHESIHVWQMIEMAVLGLIAAGIVALAASPVAGLVAAVLAVAPWGFAFWIPYLVSYAFNLWIKRLGGPEAYRNIVFEVEAYNHDHDPEYIASRPWFAWARE